MTFDLVSVTIILLILIEKENQWRILSQWKGGQAMAVNPGFVKGLAEVKIYCQLGI